MMDTKLRPANEDRALSFHTGERDQLNAVGRFQDSRSARFSQPVHISVPLAKIMARLATLVEDGDAA